MLGPYWENIGRVPSLDKFMARSINLQKRNKDQYFPGQTEQASSMRFLLYWLSCAGFSIYRVLPLHLLPLTVLDSNICTGTLTSLNKKNISCIFLFMSEKKETENGKSLATYVCCFVTAPS